MHDAPHRPEHYAVYVRTAAFVLVAALALWAPPRDASAQVRNAQVDSTFVARFQLADSFFRAGKYDRAIPLLEDLYAASPQTFAFYEKLKQAYENLKRYDDAIALVDRMLESSSGPAPLHLSERARLLFLRGDEEAAYETWEAAVAAAPRERSTYRVVYQHLVGVRLFERAIAVLVQARQVLGTDVLFESELAYLYSLTGQHETAMEEYLRVLADNERQLGFVRSRLSRFIEQEEALRKSIVVTQRAVRQTPLNRAYRELLGWLYVEAGRYANALDAYRAIDRLENEQGQVLFHFAQTAADGAAYDVALRAYEEVLDRYPDAPTAPQALLGIGDMHERWAVQLDEPTADEAGRRSDAPHYERALSTYRSFLKRHPHHPLYPEVLRRIGHLQQDVFFELSEAGATLEEVIARYPDSRAADQAAFDLGRAAVMRGDLGEAAMRFSRLADRLRTGDLAERARYEMALLHLYQGELASAGTLVDAIDTNTSTDVSNDAIALKVLLLENEGPDSTNAALRLFGGVKLLERQRRYAAALDSLDLLLARFGSHPLADEARFERAAMLRNLERHEAAYQAYAELPLLHPDSFLADRSLFQAAELQEQALGDPEGALKTYTKLLTDYPGSLLATEVRGRIRLLRGDGA